MRITRPTVDRRSEAERGFSLVEVIIAIGVLAGVLISIASMFMLGGRQVKTGKTITQATAIANDIMEQFDQRSFTALYTSLGAAATDTTKTVYSNVTGSPIASWQPTITSKLENGVASVTVLPKGPGTPTFGSATGLRLTVGLTWSELGRPQTVTVSTMRF
jgi:Tfp pilus assembly protein PilV